MVFPDYHRFPHFNEIILHLEGVFWDYILGLKLEVVFAGCMRASPRFPLSVNDLAVATNVPTPHVCSRRAWYVCTARCSLMDSH